MAYVRKKIKKGRPYYYVVESRREGPEMKTHQHILYYIGPEDKLMKLALEGWQARQAREREDGISDTGGTSPDA